MIFEVKGLSPAGQVVAMNVDAAAPEEAVRKAQAQGMSVLSARSSSQAAPRWLQRSGRLDVLGFVQELLMLLRAGLSLMAALETIAEKESRPAARAVIDGMLVKLRHGGRLSEALSGPAGAFPQILVAGVKASERTGDLDEALQRYCDYAGRLSEVTKKLKAAMIYPVMLILVGFLVTAFLIAFVVPRFASVYRDSGGDMPWASAMLFETGRLLGAYPAQFAAAAAGIVILLIGALAQPAVRVWIGQRIRALPALGRRIKEYELARLYRTLSMLLRGGTPILPAITMASTMLSASLRAQLNGAAAHIKRGESIAKALEAHGLTTPVGNRMLAVGERSGSMADMLSRIADYHDEETARSMEWVSKLFEPIMMAVLGLVIGGIVILLYMPIFDLAGSVQQ